MKMQDIIQVFFQNNKLNWLKAMKIETDISTYSSDSLLKQQISVDPASTLGPSSTMVIGIIKHPALFLNVASDGYKAALCHPGRGGRPWIDLSKSINLFLWDDPFSTEYAKQNTNQLPEITEQ